MTSDLGVELPQRTTVVWLLIGVAVLFVVPTWRTVGTALDAGDTATKVGGLAMAAGLALLMVVMPLLFARHMIRRHTFVSDAAVTWVQGERVVQQTRFDDIERIHATWDAGLGATRPNLLRDVVELTSTVEGRTQVQRISAFFVTDMRPLMTRLITVVEERPEVLPADERDQFERAVRRSDPE